MITVPQGAVPNGRRAEPPALQRTLGNIRTYGADALAEMRRLVGVMREGNAAASVIPQPGVDALTDLVQDAAAGGLAVQLTIVGAERALPAGLDLTVYRIIQEALSNVRRHARAAQVHVRLAYADSRIDIEVSDDGQGAATPGAFGHGLIGMRERAALYGGHLETGSADGHGFTVRATFPVLA